MDQEPLEHLGEAVEMRSLVFIRSNFRCVSKARHFSEQAKVNDAAKAEAANKRNSTAKAPLKDLPKAQNRREAASDYGFGRLHLNTNTHFSIQRPPVPHPSFNILVCTMLLEAVMPDHVEFFAYFSRHAALCFGLPCTVVIHMPDQHDHWTVIKGPFVHAKVKENFERRTYKRVLQIYDAKPEKVDEWVKYVHSSMPMGIDMEVTRFRWEPESVSQTLDKEAKEIWHSWSKKNIFS